MSTRRLGTGLAVATLAGSGIYLFVYLYRWEWNRALIAGMFLLAAEMVLATTAVLNRFRALEAALAAAPGTSGGGAVPPQVRARLREAAPPARDHFAWLRPDPSRLGVFVPILMGAGFVLSGLAWVVERLSRSTAGPALEHGLARRLAVLSLPAEGLVPARRRGDERLALLLAPTAGPRS